MIEFTIGDILKDDSEAIVNTVNCVGIMGRGIAMQFKNAWPKNFTAYKIACDQQKVAPGAMFVFDTRQLTAPRYIINFPTKRHWRGKSRIEDIESGLRALVLEIKERRILSIAIPPLGCGLGGLAWDDVRPLIESELAMLPNVRVRIYEPAGAPSVETMQHARKIPQMTSGRAVLIELMRRYVSGLLDPSISLLEVHKLMYFQQEAGEPLRLKYVAASYGPYAENLRHVLQAIEGYFLSGYADGGDAPNKLLSLVPGAAKEASTFLLSHEETRLRFDRVSSLFEGFETSFGLELLATVHWVLKHNPNADVVTSVHRWSERKRQFSPRQIGIARDVLAAKGWISPATPN